MAIRRADGVTFEPSGDRLVILDAEATSMLTLNVVGSVIWRALDGERDVDDLARALIDDFEGVDVATLRADIEEFVESLHEAGLVVVE